MPLPNGEVAGYQADIGAGWWGKLYEEHGRGLLVGQVAANSTSSRASGTPTRSSPSAAACRTWINGQACASTWTTPAAARRGVFGLQLHSGGPTEVRFRNLKLTLQSSPVPARPFPTSKPRRRQNREDQLQENDARPRLPQRRRLHRRLQQRRPPRHLRRQRLVRSSRNSAGKWTMHVLGEKSEAFDIKTYGDTFMNWAEDVNDDGRLDLIVVDFPGKPTWWFENPGLKPEAQRGVG